MIEIVKHKQIFNPTPFNNKGAMVAVVGAGAIGSMVAMHLAKLGLQRIVLFDDDVVEPHNLSNQMFYGPMDIGTAKVEALALKIEQLTGNEEVEVRFERILDSSGRSALQFEYVFCCVDSMTARENIFKHVVYLNRVTEWFFDGRMGSRDWSSYAVDMRNGSHIKSYTDDLYPDSDVDDELTGGCRITPSIAATAGTVANAMIWQFMMLAQGKAYRNEIHGSTEPWRVLSSREFA